MKKNKIILSAIALCAAVGSAFAVNNRLAATPVYTVAGGHFSGCYISGNIECGKTTTANAYYTTNGTVLPAGIVLRKD